MLWPDGTIKRPKISSAFGPRGGGAFGFHYGTDFVGFPRVKAVASGRVTAARWMNDDAGYTIAVDYEPGVTLVYMHMPPAMTVTRGQIIAEGTDLAPMGSSGNATGPCVHVEVRLNGKSVDPVQYINARLTGKPAAVPSKAEKWPARTLYGAAHVKTGQKLLISLGYNLGSAGADGYDGPVTQRAVLDFQKKHNLTRDGILGTNTLAKLRSVVAARKVATKYPTMNVALMGKAGNVEGFQKIARQYGYTGRVDNKWGAGSQSGFKAFLSRNGYKSVPDWLRKRWGYQGDDRLGPVMLAALKRANSANKKAL